MTGRFPGLQFILSFSKSVLKLLLAQNYAEIFHADLHSKQFSINFAKQSTFMTMYQDASSDAHLQTLGEIRNLMERSSRFISLSGLSGVAAGIFALVGAALVYLYLGKIPFDGQITTYEVVRQEMRWGVHYLTFFAVTGGGVLLGALASGIFFTTRKARRKGLKVWDRLTQRLLINLFIPLIAGALFCLILLKHGIFGLTGPTTLIFYGLALLNASKYTLPEVRYLGISEIVLGLLGAWWLGYGLELWAFGFGILHIVYGVAMWWKYERRV